MDTKRVKQQGGGGGGVMNWATGIDMYTLMCIKLMANKNLLYKKILKKKGSRPKQTFLQRRYTDCQQTHERMLNITNH